MGVLVGKFTSIPIVEAFSPTIMLIHQPMTINSPLMNVLPTHIALGYIALRTCIGSLSVSDVHF